MSILHALSLLCLVATPPGSGHESAPREEIEIHWGARRLRHDELPPDLPGAARAALDAWYEWSRVHAYRMDLDKDARALLITRASNGRVEDQLRLATGVIERFDRELPPPAVRRDAKALELVTREPEKPKPAFGDEPLPEDPEDPEGGHPWSLEPPRPVQQTASEPVVTTWGSQGQPLDTQTVVLFVVRDQHDFESLLADLAERFPFLAVWAAEAKAQQGFVIGDPLAAAYLEAPDGVEEWNPDNELVNRLARLCLLRRHGDQPNWLVHGYAWHVEMSMMGGIYCFPWRDEFVWETEHRAWPRAVSERYAKARLKPSEFMSWKRGTYVDDSARVSWGVMEYLVNRETQKLPELLDELRVFRAEHERIQDDASSWRRNLDYEIPVSEQHKMFTRVLGDGWLDQATFYLRKDLVP